MIKPIAFFDPHKGFYWAKPTKITAPVTVDVQPLALYTERTWVGLTEKDICEAAVKSQEGISPRDDTLRFAIAIEAKLKAKNETS
jgi:hypothetical protein